MNDLGIRCEGVNVTGDAVIKAGADSNQQVAALQCTNSGHSAMHAWHTHVQLVGLWESTQSHQGGDNWDAGVLSKRTKLFVCISLDNAAANVKDWLLSLTDQFDSLLNLSSMRSRNWAVAWEVNLWWPDEVQFSVLNILGDIH